MCLVWNFVLLVTNVSNVFWVSFRLTWERSDRKANIENAIEEIKRKAKDEIGMVFSVVNRRDALHGPSIWMTSCGRKQTLHISSGNRNDNARRLWRTTKSIFLRFPPCRNDFFYRGINLWILQGVFLWKTIAHNQLEIKICVSLNNWNRTFTCWNR